MKECIIIYFDPKEVCFVDNCKDIICDHHMKNKNLKKENKDAKN